MTALLHEAEDKESRRQTAKKGQPPTGLPQYLKSEIYASQTMQACTCNFTDAAQLCTDKIPFQRREANRRNAPAGETLYTEILTAERPSENV